MLLAWAYPCRTLASAERLFTNPEAVVLMRPITASQKFHITSGSHETRHSKWSVVEMQPSCHHKDCLGRLKRNTRVAVGNSPENPEF